MPRGTVLCREAGAAHQSIEREQGTQGRQGQAPGSGKGQEACHELRSELGCSAG